MYDRKCSPSIWAMDSDIWSFCISDMLDPPWFRSWLECTSIEIVQGVNEFSNHKWGKKLIGFNVRLAGLAAIIVRNVANTVTHNQASNVCIMNKCQWF